MQNFLALIVAFSSAVVLSLALPAQAAKNEKDYDKSMSGCEMSCGSGKKVSEYLIKPQSQAKSGDYVRCPVSGAVFEIQEGANRVTHEGKTYHTCCAACAKKFQEQAARFARNLE